MVDHTPWVAEQQRLKRDATTRRQKIADILRRVGPRHGVVGDYIYKVALALSTMLTSAEITEGDVVAGLGKLRGSSGDLLFAKARL